MLSVTWVTLQWFNLNLALVSSPHGKQGPQVLERTELYARRIDRSGGLLWASYVECVKSRLRCCVAGQPVDGLRTGPGEGFAVFTVASGLRVG